MESFLGLFEAKNDAILVPKGVGALKACPEVSKWCEKKATPNAKANRNGGIVPGDFQRYYSFNLYRRNMFGSFPICV